MKLGVMSAILEHLEFEEMIKKLSEIGYECVEVACWPKGKAERRYAGVSHIDVDNFDVDEIHSILDKYNMEISALAYYPNVLDPEKESAEVALNHLKKVINAAQKLSVKMVTTFVGRDPKKTVDENFETFKQVWPDLIEYAKQHDVKIAIENCPMWFSNDEWPGGKNLMTSPANFKRAFEIIDSDYFGLNFDPSHFVWQQMDYVSVLHQFKEKIFHIHFKDIKVYPDKLNQVGIMANPLEYMSPKLPGLGDVRWDEYVSALNDIGYQGYAVVEVEDKAYEDSPERIEKSVELSYNYLRQYVI